MNKSNTHLARWIVAGKRVCIMAMFLALGGCATLQCYYSEDEKSLTCHQKADRV